jgi:hypothetical protein
MTPRRLMTDTVKAWLARLLLVSWDVPATPGAPEALSLTRLLRQHLATPGRRPPRAEQ